VKQVGVDNELGLYC